MTCDLRPPELEELQRYALTYDHRQFADLTFLLGNRGGFILHLPATTNIRDRTLQSTKWFGASGFGRAFFEGFLASAEYEGKLVPLDRRTQVELKVELHKVTRTYQVGPHQVKESFFVPDHRQAFIVHFATDLPLSIKPEFDMRYYQSLNTDFSNYRAEAKPEGLFVSNRAEVCGPLCVTMDFFGLVGLTECEDVRIEMLPEGKRLVDKTYLKDEQREKLIFSVYKETQETSPDHAPIWDLYQTKVFAPAVFHGTGPLSFICTFGDSYEEAAEAYADLKASGSQLEREKQETIATQLTRAKVDTGNHEVDAAYAHVLTRFNEALVARDACLHIEPVHRDHYYAIFAGNKYFLDAWKRDENISLRALLETNDYETARQILDDTWQYQDERTGRLPHIIRAGEPLVYYSSDGTIWAAQRLLEYTRESGDSTLLQQKLSMVEHFFDASMRFVKSGFLPSGGIIEKDYLWETWEDTPYTPRDGFPVEIELIWLTILEGFLPYFERNRQALAEKMSQTLDEGRINFERFVRDGYLVDSLSYDWRQRELLTPNGYVAFGLDYDLPLDLQRSMVVQARDQLAGRRGVRSLAPRDWPKVLPAEFLADRRVRRGNDMASVGIYNYHRGIEWEWLNSFFVAGELACGDVEHAYRSYLAGQVREAVHEVGVGGLSELHDMRGQLGADFQAWSMAALLESIRAFAGIKVDALSRRIIVRPSIPSAWPHFMCRSRIGSTFFDVNISQMKGTVFRVEVECDEKVPADHQLKIGVRVPAGSDVAAVESNGQSLSVSEWELQTSPGSDLKGVVWVTRPLQETVTLEVTLTPA